jgi:hypothetical protein
VRKRRFFCGGRLLLDGSLILEPHSSGHHVPLSPFGTPLGAATWDVRGSLRRSVELLAKYSSGMISLTAVADVFVRNGLCKRWFEPFAIMLPRGDWSFRLAVNTALAHVFRSGEIVGLYTKYLGDVGLGASNWAGVVFMSASLPE